MRTEQKYQDRQRKIRKRGKKVVGLGICVFLVLLLASQFHYEKRIQKFVLRHEEELTELAELYLESDETQKQKLLEKERCSWCSTDGIVPGNSGSILYGRIWACTFCRVLWILLFTRRYSGWNRGRSACKSRGRQCVLELAGIRRQWRGDSKNKAKLVLL